MTLNDFIMESAIVETTNDTSVSDIQMEQWNAEINVASAMFDVMTKYAMLSEYATCDVDEFFTESKYGPSVTAKLTGKIAKVEEWKKDGNAIKKVLGTIAIGVLKMVRAVARFFKKRFVSEKNPFRKLAKWLKEKKANRAAKKAEEGLSEKEIKKLNSDAEYQLQGQEKRHAAQMAEMERKNAALEKKAGYLLANCKELAAKFKVTNAALDKANAALDATKKALENASSEKNRLQTNLVDKVNELNQAEDLLRKAFATQNKNQRRATNKAIGAFLDRNDPVMEDIEVAAKASEETAEKLEAVEVKMADISEVINKADGGNSDLVKYAKDALVSVKFIVQTGQELGNEVTGSKVSLPSAQNDPVLNQFAI
jgi:chromosome segregation ATPase